jgi:hypothetical protein
VTVALADTLDESLHAGPRSGRPAHRKPKLYLASHRRPDGSLVIFDAAGNKVPRVGRR